MQFIEIDLFDPVDRFLHTVRIRRSNVTASNKMLLSSKILN